MFPPYFRRILLNLVGGVYGEKNLLVSGDTRILSSKQLIFNTVSYSQVL
jgi:hypothetical protein